MTKRYPTLSPALADELRSVDPSSDGHCEYWPCRVQLMSGDWFDRVYLVEGDSFMDVWGIDPDDDPAKSSVSVEDVSQLEPSPYRLPATLANKLYAAGESGMGYYTFTAVLRDGRRLPYVTGNAVDFPALPDDVTGAEVVDVLPHTGLEHFRDREPRASETDAAYRWCLFER